MRRPEQPLISKRRPDNNPGRIKIIVQRMPLSQTRAMVNAAPETLVLGTGNLNLVLGIEAGRPPEELAERCEHLLRFFEGSGAEAVVLGCTHFPYVKEALQRRTGLPVLDPSETLAELVLAP